MIASMGAVFHFIGQGTSLVNGNSAKQLQADVCEADKPNVIMPIGKINGFLHNSIEISEQLPTYKKAQHLRCANGLPQGKNLCVYTVFIYFFIITNTIYSVDLTFGAKLESAHFCF